MIRNSNRKRGLIPKLLSPINSFEGAVRVIDAGADEVYCGVAMTGKGKNFALYRGPGASPAQLPTYDDLERVVEHAHRHGVEVILVANEPFMSEELEEGMRNHIRLGVDKGVDALMIGDMGVFSLVRDLGVDVPLYASTYFVSMNSEATHFLRKLGFSRVILERHLTLDEISEIVSHSKVDIEVFCHYGGCSNINANCYFYHLFIPEKVKRELLQYQKKSKASFVAPCTIPYDVYEITNERKWLGNAPILDAATCCSLCHVQALVRAGVAGLKIVGRSRRKRGLWFSSVETNTRIYRKFLDLIGKDRVSHKNLKKVISSLRKEFDDSFIEELKLRALSRVRGPGKAGLTRKILPYYEFFCREKRCIFSSLFNVPYRARPPKPREIRL